ncbi:protein AF-10-like [Megalops cyprinoides]|uniref:protein AF-10-like n=1 Tax=Megalops cyprinoides TaxID=118141 RepID=UPI0018649DF0|nr:protein AF-10-like [Megalops cyprinoides]
MLTVCTSQKRQEDASSGRFTNANFQEVPCHTAGTAKDGPPTEGKGTEGRGKKAGSHGSGHRGRKATPGKPSLTTGDTATPPTAATPASSLFQPGVPSVGSSAGAKASTVVVPSPAEYRSISESDPQNESSYPQLSLTWGSKVGALGGAPEVVPPLSTVSSPMSMPPGSASSGRKPFESCWPAASARYKRAAKGEEGAKVKKKRGKWRNRYGPCWSLETPSIQELSKHPHQPPSAAPTPSTTSSEAAKEETSLPRNGNLHSHSVSSSPIGPGAFPSDDVQVPVPGTVGNSNTELPLQDPAALPLTASLPPPSPLPLSTTGIHSNSLPGFSFNLAPSHMLGNRLNPNSAMTAMFVQSEGCPADPEMATPGQGASLKVNLSPCSSAKGLQIRYDPSGPALPSLTTNSTNMAPFPVPTSMEQLLERQWNEGQQFLLQQGTSGDLLGMLMSLHQLQVENRHLEEQIKTLTVQKERLQLLNAQLSVPFTPARSAYTSTGSSSSSPRSHPPNSHTVLDVLNNTQLGNSFFPDSTLSLSMQDLSSGNHSSSSSLSTPPSLGYTSPQHGQLQVNGMVGGAVQAAPILQATPNLPGITGMMGVIPGDQLAMNGIVGALNGVIQTTSSLPHPAGMSLTTPSSLSNSSAGLGLISEQQRQILLHQHQFQQLFSSPQPIPEQQALLYQLSSPQLPLSGLLPAAQSSMAANPFLAMQTDTAQSTRLVEKGRVVSSQEKS